MTASLTIIRLGSTYTFQFQGRGERARPVMLAEQGDGADAQFQARYVRAVGLLNQVMRHRPTTEAAAEAAAADADSVAPADPLLALGRMLFHQLVPGAIQQALRNLPPGTPLQIATNAPEIPWELLHDETDYLSTRLVVARTLVTARVPRASAPTRRHPFTTLLIGNPTGDLPETAAEIEEIARQLEAVPGAAPPRIFMRRRASKEALLQELASGGYDLIHYAGHAQFVPGDAAASGLRLAGDTILTVAELERSLGGHPFIFLNACESGRSAAPAEHEARAMVSGTSFAGLAEVFLQAGAAGVLGTLWPVHDGGSGRAARDFYRAALRGESVAAALRTTRQTTLQSDGRDPLWAAFVLYGSATYALPLPPQQMRRPVTVLAVHLHDMGTMYGRPHAEATARGLDAHLQRVTESVLHYGGQVRMTAPDGLTAVFGLAGAQQNDAERAVRAAADMVSSQLDRAADDAVPPISIGVSSGEVFVRTGHGPDAPDAAHTQRGAVLGAAVYQATQLARHAPPGSVYAAPSVLPLVAGRVQTAPVADAAMDGVQILGLRPEERQRPALFAPETLVGREAELEQLLRLWHACQQGRGQLVGLAGEAGIGKTHLLHTLRTRIETDANAGYRANARWLALTAPSAYAPRPYELVAQLVEPLLRALSPPEDATSPLDRAQVEQALGQLPVPLPEAQARDAIALLGDVLLFPTADLSLAHLDAAARQRRLVALLGRLLTAHTGESPTVLAVEDLHGADAVSLDVLSGLVAGIDRLPLLLLTTFRTDDAWQPPWWNRRNYTQIHLDALGNADSAELLGDLLGDLLRAEPVPQTVPPTVPPTVPIEVPMSVADALLERSQGNPLFLRELVAALREAGVLRLAGKAWTLDDSRFQQEVPGSVQRVLLTRIERLPAPAQQVLTMAAVVGDPMEPALLNTLLAGTLDAAGITHALGELEGRDFIHPLWGSEWGSETIQFRHGLVREVAYGRLLLDERRRHHRRVGELLAGSAPASGNNTAPSIGANVEAIAQHFFYSVTVPVGAGQWDVAQDAPPAELERAARALVRAGNRARDAYAARDALRHYTRARLLAQARETDAEPTDAELAVAICDGMAAAHQIVSQFDAAIAELHRARELLPQPPTDETGSLRTADFARRIGLLHEWKGELDTALEWLQSGLDSLPATEAQGSPAARGLAAAIHMRLGSVHFNRGDLAAAAAACREGLALIEGDPQRRVQAEAHNLLGTIHAVQGENEAALAQYNQSLHIWTELADPYQAARVEDNLGGTHLWIGQWDAAADHLARGYRFWESIDDEFNRAFASLNLGLIALYRGQWAQAQERFDESLGIWSAAENGRWLALCHTNLGLLAIARTQWAAARTHLETALELLHRDKIQDLLPEALYAMADVELAAGNAPAAAELAERAADLAAALEMQTEHGVALRTLGRVALARGALAEGKTALTESLTLLTQARNRYERARTLVALAALHAARGDAAAENAARAEAISTFRTLGARGDLRALGVD